MKTTSWSSNGTSMVDIKKPWLFLAAIVMLTALVFSGCIGNDFINNWDDNINVTQNNYIKDFSWQGIKTLFNNETQIGEPRLTLFTFMLQYRIWELSPMPYHIANLILHLLNILLVFIFIKKLSKNNIIALLTALLFALHPLRTEAVYWVTGRKDLLFTFFFLLSLLTYLFYLNKNKNIFVFLAVIALSYFSFISKIQAVSIPVVLLSLDIYYKRKIDIQCIIEKALIFYFLLFGFTDLKITGYSFAIFLIWFFRKNINEIAIPLTSKKAINILLIVIFIILIIIFIRDLGTPLILINIRSITLLFLFFVIDKRIILTKLQRIIRTGKILRITAGIIFFVAMIFIIVLLKQNLHLWTKDSFQDYSIIQRIFMAGYSLLFYLIKFIFPFELCAIYPYPKLIEGQLPAIYFIYSGIILFITGFVTFLLVTINSLRKEILFGLTFFCVNIFLVLHIIPIEGRVITAERYTYLAFLGLFYIISVILANILTSTKTAKNIKIVVLAVFSTYIISFIFIDISRTKVWKNGFTLFTDIIKKLPDYDLAYNNRGTLYFNKGNYESAMQDFDKAIKVNPDFKLAYYNRALLFVNLSKFENAIIDCNTAVSIDSLYYDAYYLRGFSNNKSGKYHEAITDYNKVLKIKPDHLLAVYNRGNSRKNINDYIGAIKDYSIALQIKSDFAEAYNSRGVAKYFIEDYSGSLLDYDKATKLQPTNGNYYYNKALSELKINNQEEACASLRKSIELGYNQGQELLSKNCK